MKRLFIAMFLVMSSLFSMADTYTVYYDNSQTNWTEVWVWLWDGDDNYTGDEWPGVQMTYDSTTGYYVYTFEADALADPYVKFSDGNGTEVPGNDAFVNGHVYNYEGDEAVAATTWTVYYDNSLSQWTTVYAYIWDDNGASPLGDWPGTQMTAPTGSSSVWSLTFTTKYDLENPVIMFDDGAKSPTDDDETNGEGFAYINGATYTYNGKTESGGSGTGEVVESYTVTFTDTGSPAWDDVYIYVYDANGTAPVGVWPGTKMTQNGSSWTYTVTSDVALTDPKVIFNDGALNSTASDQTAAADLIDGHSYTRDGDTQAETRVWSVTFTDDGDTKWETVYAYIWDDNNSYPLGEWPGTAMNSAGNNTWTLSFTTKYDLVNPMIMFDDGAKSPTADDETDGNGFEYTNGGSYKRSDAGVTKDDTGNSGSTGSGTGVTYTAYFDNSLSNWTTVYGYVYDGAYQYAGEWPGTKLSQNASGLYVFTFTGGETLTDPYVIFNNYPGADQTDGLPFVNGHTYNRIGDTAAEKIEWTVYFEDDGAPAWNEVYAYIWDENNSVPLGPWPGTAMTLQSDGTWALTFYTTVELSSPLIIFNDGETEEPGLDDETDADGMDYINGATYNRETITQTPGTTYSVTLVDNLSPAWTSVYMYVTDENNAEPVGEWPGMAMTSSGTNTWSGTFTTTMVLSTPTIQFSDGIMSDGVVNGMLWDGKSYTRDETTLGISGVASESGNDVIYTLQGIRVNGISKKGIYIINGKKVVK